MSFQPAIPGLFSPAKGAAPVESTTSSLPPTEKQISYAANLARRLNKSLPNDMDRASLSKWIDAHKTTKPEGKFANYPSSKQVAFAERLATLKRNPVPPECFRDRALMSRWIDSNKPR